jgi:ABC-2 type transport system permease protein
MEWRRGRRATVVLIVTTLLMTLTAASAWINTTLQRMFPGDGVSDQGPVSLGPLDNLAAAVGSQFFIFAAIFAVASLVIRERETGTLAWVASKPVSRGSIWTAKWLTASGMLAIVAVLIPLAATAVVVAMAYGVPDGLAVVALAIGMVATVVFYVTVGLTFGTILRSQVAVVAATLGVFALPVFVGFIPMATPFLPQSILTWAMGMAIGAPVGFITPIAYVVITAAIAWYGIRRMDGLEL